MVGGSSPDSGGEPRLRPDNGRPGHSAAATVLFPGPKRSVATHREARGSVGSRRDAQGAQTNSPGSLRPTFRPLMLLLVMVGRSIMRML